MKDPEQDWQEGIRRVYRESSVLPAVNAHAVARLAVTQGWQRVNARAIAKATRMGVVISLLASSGAYVWAEIEADRMTEALISEGLSWMH